ncbi:SDR family NAD(P)-dependent oxidoreductase [Actinomadura roseirufa]|uniref:SDR family NAD(P)-dependent oxidoreductase n=1 Tax=Actinomadura roseirufa TaxID=2094049 RepID=UPI0010412738|nr:SDR family NAD(P)-dependent oxidoreductase [Actinomadura roseirufa]
MSGGPPAGAVIVTGAGSGVGASTATALAGRGYRVVAAVHSLDRTAGLDELVARSGAEVEVAELDVTDEPALPAFTAGVVARHGGLHAVVNSAGVTGVETFEDEDLANYRRVFDVNVFGPVALFKSALPYLRASGGRIIAVGSIAGVLGLPFQESYSGSKFALEGILEAFAPVARRSGVAVSVVEPGPISTEAVRRTDWIRVFKGAGPYEGLLRQYVDNAAALRGTLPGLPPTQTPAEVAEAIVDLLASDDPPFRCPTAPGTRLLLARKLADVSGETVGEVTGRWLDAATSETAE